MQHGMLPHSFHDLVETLPEDGCVVCRLMLRAADRFLDKMVYERTNDLNTHYAFRSRRGLCNEHSSQALEYQGSSLSMAILFAAVFDEVLKIVDTADIESGENQSLVAQMLGKPKNSSILADQLEPESSCMVCDVMEETGQRLIQTLCSHITHPKLHAAFSTSSGLCIPHFRQALRQPAGAENRQTLILLQQEIWETLLGELRELIDKNDYRRIQEPRGREGSSWSRAAAQAAGARGVFGVDHHSSKR